MLFLPHLDIKTKHHVKISKMNIIIVMKYLPVAAKGFHKPRIIDLCICKRSKKIARCYNKTIMMSLIG